MNTFFPSPEELLEQGVNVAKKQVQITAKQVATQVTGQQNSPADANNAVAARDQMNKDFIKDMYQPTSLSKPHMQSGQQNLATTIMSQLGGSKSQDDKSIEDTRKQLELLQKQHKEGYFTQTFDRRSKPEERVQDKLEREEQEEQNKRWELQQKKEKERPIALTMSTNKAEQFRGASG